MARFASGLSKRDMDDFAWVDSWRMERADRQNWPALEWKERFLLLSKRLSSTLRHTSAKEGFKMRKDGCIAARDLLANYKYKEFTEDDILTCIAPGHNKKERFELIVEGSTSWVRARQGHSQDVAGHIDETELNTRITLEAAPLIAIHGTFSNLLETIRKEGLKRFERQYVHMASGLPGDGSVVSGCRTGTDVFLYIDVASAIRDGIEFMLSGNDVILTAGIDGVLPSSYILGAINRRGRVLFGTIPKEPSPSDAPKQKPANEPVSQRWARANASSAPSQMSSSEKAGQVANASVTAAPSQLSSSERAFLKVVKPVRDILKLEALGVDNLDKLQKQKIQRKDEALEDLALAEKSLPKDSELRVKNTDIIALLPSR